MKRGVAVYIAVAAACGMATVLAVALLTNIFERKQEAKNPYVRLVEVSEGTVDSAPWGVNWSREHEGYLRTVDTTRTKFGGSEAGAYLPDPITDTAKLRYEHQVLMVVPAEGQPLVIGQYGGPVSAQGH